MGNRNFSLQKINWRMERENVLKVEFLLNQFCTFGATTFKQWGTYLYDSTVYQWIITIFKK